MAWVTSRRRDRLPGNWQSIRKSVLERDQYRCAVPGCAVRATDVDHIDRFGGDEPGNLAAMCGPHHRTKSSKEGADARWAPRRRMKRQPEQHPGIIAEPGAYPVLPWQVKLETPCPSPAPSRSDPTSE